MHSRPVGVLLACFLLVSASAAVVGDSETTISGVDVEGSGLATVEGDTTFVWQSETTMVNVTVSTGDVSEPNHEVCVHASGLEDGQRELGCEYPRLESNSTTTVSVPISEWPDAAVGSSLSLDVTLTKALSGTDVDDASTSVTVVAKDGQFDGDQLSNERELEVGTNLSSKDTDSDGLWDGQEVDDVGSDPLSKDTDGDGVRDAVEVNYGTDPTLEDTDDDGLTDDEEINEYNTDPLDEDTDDDGLSDGREVNELNSSPTEADTDDDGLEDPTELEVGTDLDDPDTDDDGLTDGEEYNQYGTDPLESDTDGDGVADGREVHELGTNPNVADADSDGDLLSDELELQLGTDPGSAFSPWGYVGLFLLVGGFVGTQMYHAGWRIQREQRTVRGRHVLVPTVTRIGGGTASTRSREHERTPPARGESTRSTDSGPAHPGEPRSGPVESAGVSAGTASTADSADSVERSGAETGDDAPTRQDLPEQAFLTDADRVTQILEEAGGNCRQQDIVRETGWSKSKVSRLLSQMADDDEVRKISLGRENVIVLPGEEPDAVRSALDDE